MIFRILLLVLLWCICSSAQAAELQIGKSSPALIVQETDGGSFDLNQQRGKIVLVHFWATWCPDCREEMLVLDAFYRHHGDKVEVMALSIDPPRALGKVKEIMQPFAYKAAMIGNVRVNDFGTPDVLPVTYVIDAEGILREVVIPAVRPLTEQDFDAAVLPLLAVH